MKLAHLYKKNQNRPTRYARLAEYVPQGKSPAEREIELLPAGELEIAEVDFASFFANPFASPPPARREPDYYSWEDNPFQKYEEEKDLATVKAEYAATRRALLDAYYDWVAENAAPGKSDSYAVWVSETVRQWRRSPATAAGFTPRVNTGTGCPSGHDGASAVNAWAAANRF